MSSPPTKVSLLKGLQNVIEISWQKWFNTLPTLDNDNVFTGDNTFSGTNAFSNPILATFPLLHIQDQKTSGTAGGTFTSGAWRTRDLNTVVTNEITGASLATNQITLPTGDYFISAQCPCYRVNRSLAILWNDDDSDVVVTGSPCYASDGYAGHDYSFIGRRFSLAAGGKALEIRQRCDNTHAGNGFGVDAGTAFTVDHETYTDVKIWQIS